MAEAAPPTRRPSPTVAGPARPRPDATSKAKPLLPWGRIAIGSAALVGTAAVTGGIWYLIAASKKRKQKATRGGGGGELIEEPAVVPRGTGHAEGWPLRVTVALAAQRVLLDPRARPVLRVLQDLEDFAQFAPRAFAGLVEAFAAIVQAQRDVEGMGRDPALPRMITRQARAVAAAQMATMDLQRAVRGRMQGLHADRALGLLVERVQLLLREYETALLNAVQLGRMSARA